MLNHFSLFSGIGANDLAAEWAGFRTVGQCEWADFPTKVLEKHWPDVPRWRDIHDLTGNAIRSAGISDITVLSGGFPCQPHSIAGKRKASSDERDLWPEYKRIICETKPRWVVGENVSGILTSESGRFFGGILRDLAELGFDVGWCCIPASWVGAIHRRERLFVIAHTNSKRIQGLDIQKSIRPDSEEPFRWELTGAIDAALPADDYARIRGNFDGVPQVMDQLKSIGNSIVPYQVYPIYQAIADIEAQSAGSET
jgi:DNA (cytosine-5)-methyltransferase 1